MMVSLLVSISAVAVAIAVFRRVVVSISTVAVAIAVFRRVIVSKCAVINKSTVEKDIVES
jgi:hypothetical protein